MKRSLCISIMFVLWLNGLPATAGTMHNPASDSLPAIGVLELRNYLLKPGMCDKFAHYFEANLITPQEELGAYPLGQYQVKGSPDNFFWLRGYRSMKERSVFLPAFYYKSDSWKKHASTANSMMLNTDNVYLLHPVKIGADTITQTRIPAAQLQQGEIMVVDFYVANARLAALKNVVAKAYLPFIETCGIKNYTVWESELEQNDFPALPAFQDRNLLVIISFFRDEKDYLEKMKLVRTKMPEQLYFKMADVVTFRTTTILDATAYTKKSAA